MDLMVSSDATVGISVGPFEGLGAFVVALNIASNFAGEVGFGGKDAAGDQVALNFREPDFELIEPGRVSRGVMELKVGMGGEELSDGFGLVHRKVVGDDMDLLTLGLRGGDICEKGDELRAGVALGGFGRGMHIRRGDLRPKRFLPLSLLCGRKIEFSPSATCMGTASTITAVIEFNPACYASVTVAGKSQNSEPMQKGMSLRGVPPNRCVLTTLRVRFDHTKLEPLAERNGVISLSPEHGRRF